MVMTHDGDDFIVMIYDVEDSDVKIEHYKWCR